MTDNKKGSPGTEGVRIAKALARAGVASRREIERMIEAGRVRVDGKVLKTPATLVTSLEGITVDGQPVGQAEPPRLWRYHKPRGLLTTNRDPEGRATIFDHLPANLPRVVTVGRLDLNTEGLLLLTNDGGLARWMELPATGWTRTYRVRVHGTVSQDRLKSLADGVTVDGMMFGPVEATLEKQQGANAWLSVSLAEGKNREVRRIMEHLGLSVSRLIRVRYGPFNLAGIDRGHVAPVSPGRLEEAAADYLSSLGAAPTLAPPAPDRSKWAKAKPKPKRPAARRPRKTGSDDVSTGPGQRAGRPQPRGAGPRGARRAPKRD